MVNYRNRLMALIDVLKSRLSRHKDKLKDLELLVDKNQASSNQKQQFVELKAKIEEDETIIDLAEGLLETDDS